MTTTFGSSCSSLTFLTSSRSALVRLVSDFLFARSVLSSLHRHKTSVRFPLSSRVILHHTAKTSCLFFCLTSRSSTSSSSSSPGGILFPPCFLTPAGLRQRSVGGFTEPQNMWRSGGMDVRTLSSTSIITRFQPSLVTLHCWCIKIRLNINQIGSSLTN